MASFSSRAVILPFPPPRVAGKSAAVTVSHLAAATARNLDGRPNARAQLLRQRPVLSFHRVGRNPG
ncbi:hypothetical protein E2562_021974 [Oryza meyeriana var. granulata]|uniref:Uncharacterized protein n=1 Tax=Oryza meyeriana var. granulata TaxID=110450 RepID=A0A6G1DKG8_9ORYZ|nr:hypothetical protein E2562_021974 [Oryza meyeriana var. granulata]